MLVEARGGAESRGPGADDEDADLFFFLESGRESRERKKERRGKNSQVEVEKKKKTEGAIDFDGAQKKKNAAFSLRLSLLSVSRHSQSNSTRLLRNVAALASHFQFKRERRQK